MPDWTVANLAWGFLGLGLVIIGLFATVGLGLWYEKKGEMDAQNPN